MSVKLYVRDPTAVFFFLATCFGKKKRHTKLRFHVLSQKTNNGHFFKEDL